MYYNVKLQPALASQFATSLTKASIWNCILSVRGNIQGVKVRVTDDNKAVIRKAYDKLSHKSCKKSKKSK